MGWVALNDSSNFTLGLDIDFHGSHPCQTWDIWIRQAQAEFVHSATYRRYRHTRSATLAHTQREARQIGLGAHPFRLPP